MSERSSPFIDKNWVIGILISLFSALCGVVFFLSTNWITQRFDYQETLLKSKMSQYDEDLKSVKNDLKLILQNQSSLESTIRVNSLRIQGLEQMLINDSSEKKRGLKKEGDK